MAMTARRAHFKRIDIADAKLRLAGSLRGMAQAGKHEQRRARNRH
jgi:hypothetical protein